MTVDQSLGASVTAALSSALTVSASLALSGSALGASQTSLATALSGFASIPALASVASSVVSETARAQRAEASIAGLIAPGTYANPATSCLAVFSSNPSFPNGLYYLSINSVTLQAYCDIANGGWTLLAKFASTGDWYYGSARWTDNSVFNANTLLDFTTVASAKSSMWSYLPISQLRIDTTASAPGAAPFVIAQNPLNQTMYALMNTAGQSLNTVGGSIGNLPCAHPGFQGSVGTPSTQMVTNFVASASSYGFSAWPGCNSCINRVRLGSASGGGLNINSAGGAVNVGFNGLGGTTSFRDADGSCPGCTCYAQAGETNLDTSGFNANLWGK